MHRSTAGPLVASAALALLAACQPAAPADLSAADKATIDSLDHEFTRLAMAGKMEDLVAMYYSDDVVLMAPNAPAANGHAAATALLKGFPPITAFTLNTDEIVGHGDLAYLRGHYTMVFSPPGAPAMPDSGKYLEIWRKGADGKWKAARDMFSSDIPLPPAPMPADVKATKKKP